MCAACNWPSASFTNTSDRKILSRLCLLTKLSWGAVECLSAKSLRWSKNLSEAKIVQNKRKTWVKVQKFTTGPPSSVPSLVRQGNPLCHPPEKIKKSSFSPLFDVGRHWINLASGYLDLRLYPYHFKWCKLYTQLTSWWVKPKFILSFRASTLPNNLNMFGAHLCER